MDASLLREIVSWLLVPGGVLGAWITLRRGRATENAAARAASEERQDRAYEKAQALVDNAIESVKKQMARLEGEVDDLRSELTGAYSQIASLRTELEQERQRSDEVRRQLREEQGKVRIAEEQIRIAEDRIADLTARLAAANVPGTPGPSGAH